MVLISINPTTEEKIAEFKESSDKELDLAIDNSRTAQRDWASKTKEFRIQILLNIMKEFEKRKDEVITTINEECGFDKEEINAVHYDVIEGFKHYIKRYQELNSINLESDVSEPNIKTEIIFQPSGIVLQLGAWNYPLWQTMITAIPALLTGNSIIYKPSERATKTGLLINNIINSAKDASCCISPSELSMM